MHGALKTKPPNLHRHNDGQPEVQKCVNVWNIRQSNEGLTSSNQVKLGNQNGFDSNMDKLYMMNYMIILKDIIYIYIYCIYLYIMDTLWYIAGLWSHCWHETSCEQKIWGESLGLDEQFLSRLLILIAAQHVRRPTLDMNCIFISKTS